jgi:hypothetical protein
MEISNKRQADDVPAGPAAGLKGPTFGLARERLNRLEVGLALRGGGSLTLFVELDSEVSPEAVEAFAAELAEGVAGSQSRTFVDSSTATGQRSWVNLGEVVAFSVRQAR